jgi:hypothetical protein
VALLGVYAGLDPKLRLDLSALGVTFDGPLDPYNQLRIASLSAPRIGPPLHQLHLAFAAMRLLGHLPRPPGEDEIERLRPAAERLLATTPPGDRDEATTRIIGAMRAASAVELEDQWKQVVQTAGDLLDPKLARIQEAWCRPELRSVGDEVASRVETRLVVRSERTLAQLALAVLPDNWSRCNDFFCSLTRAPDRDTGCPGATGGNLTATAPHWRGVYEERVGDCPEGWFPDTYLLFTWDLAEHQLILRYELAPNRRRGDHTVLRIDQGYIQVDELDGSYEVSTVKYLLFDDDYIPSGGQTLGQSACQLGWLDYSINQFTDDCANALPSGVTTQTDEPPGPEPSVGIDSRLEEVLDRCEAHLLQLAEEVDTQTSKVVNKVRKGTYRLDDFVGDCGQLYVQSIRNGSRLLEGQISFGLAAVDRARMLSGRRNGPHD